MLKKTFRLCWGVGRSFRTSSTSETEARAETLYWDLFKCLPRVDAADSDSDLSNGLNLTAYSQVTSQRTQRKRPVVFNPAALSKTVIQKILGTGSATDFTAAKPGECVSEPGCKNTKMQQTSKKLQQSVLQEATTEVGCKQRVKWEVFWAVKTIV